MSKSRPSWHLRYSKLKRNWIKSSLRSDSNLCETFCSHFWLALCLSFVLNHNYSGELLLFLLVPFVFVSASVSLSLMFHQNSSIWFIFDGFACLTFRAVAGIGICRRDIYRKLLHHYSRAGADRISTWSANYFQDESTIQCVRNCKILFEIYFS